MRAIKAAVCLIVLAALAAESRADDNWLSFDASAGWKSKYVLSSGVPAYNKPVVQANMKATMQKLCPGLYACLWFSVPAGGTNFNSDYGSEVDYTLGWSGKVFEEVNMDVGVSYFDVYELWHGNNGDIVSPYLELSRDFRAGAHTITPYAGIHWYLPANGREPERGFNWFAGACHSFDICKGLGVRWGGDLFWDDGACGGDSGWLLRGKAALSLNLNKAVTLELLSLNAYVPLTIHDARKPQFVVGAGVSFSF